MPSFKYDDQDVPFQPGDTIIQATDRVGISIPHYCWHPGLSVAANCRMCLVELLPPPGRPALQLDVLRWDPQIGDYVAEKKPKLVPACQQTVTDGMQVKSESSEHVKRARSSVQEMLLLNHPVDCPICDQAGECKLQDYWLEHQATKKRMREEPIHKPKAVSFGPTIVYDAERCIVCTRCVRVCTELAKDPVLDLRERGNLKEIVLAPGRLLDHPYSLMTEHVCPVGALTAKDFRFKARVWFLRSARTICQGCATGCNAHLDYDPRNQTAYRHRPRENPAVNQYWMCDEGMLSTSRVHDHRVLSPLVRGRPEGAVSAVTEAASRLAEARGQRLAVVLSAQYSNEDNRALLDLGRKLGVSLFAWSGNPEGPGDDILRHVDKNPNRAGVFAIAQGQGLTLIDEAELLRRVEGGQVKNVLALGGAVHPESWRKLATSLGALVVLGSHESPLSRAAQVLLPASSWAEYTGTYVNAKGMSQESQGALSPLGDSRPAYQWVLALAAELQLELGWHKGSELRRIANGTGASLPPPAVQSAATPAGAAE